jgi:hypothetical protein
MANVAIYVRYCGLAFCARAAEVDDDDDDDVEDRATIYTSKLATQPLGHGHVCEEFLPAAQDR